MSVSNGIDAPHGQIKVALVPDPNYTLLASTAEKPTEYIFTIHDSETPVITISDAPEISPESMAQFVLESDILPHEALSIRYTASNTSGNFLGTTTADQSVTFTQPTPDHPITGILTIPTIQDLNSTEGTITVSIMDDDTTPKDYTFSTDTTKRSATVQIKKTGLLPTLSIKPSEEDANEGGTVKYILTASHNPGQNALNVKWTYDEEAGNFLDTAHQDQMTATNTTSRFFTQAGGVTTAPWTAEITLHLKPQQIPLMKNMEALKLH